MDWLSSIRDLDADEMACLTVPEDTLCDWEGCEGYASWELVWEDLLSLSAT